MSWWNTSQLTSFATSAIKSAQKKIDKVLDIPTEDDSGKKSETSWSAWASPSLSFHGSHDEALSVEKPKSPPPFDLEEENKVELQTPVSLLSSDKEKETTESEASVSKPIVESLSDTASAKSLSRLDSPRRERTTPTKSKGVDKTTGGKRLGAVKLGAQRLTTGLSSVVRDEKPDTAEEKVVGVSVDSFNIKPVPSCQSSVDADPIALYDGTPSIDDAIVEISNHVEICGSSNVVCDSLTPLTDNDVRNETKNEKHSTDELLDNEKVNPPDKHLLRLSSADEVLGIATETPSPEMKVLDDSYMISSNSGLNSNEPKADILTAGESLDEFCPANQLSKGISIVCNSCDEASLTTQELSVCVLPSEINSEASEALTFETCSSQSANPETLFDDSIQPQLVNLEPHIQDGKVTTYHQPLPRDSQAHLSVDNKLNAFANQDEMLKEESHLHTSDSSIHLDISTADPTIQSTSSESTVIDQPEELVKSSNEGILLIAHEVESSDLPQSMTDSLMEQSHCSDASYVKCERPSTAEPPFSRVESGNDLSRRAPSEFSFIASNDFETGASSDIEIISMASTYYDGNGDNRVLDFIPLSRNVFKTKIRDISPDEISPTLSQHSPNSDKEDSSVGRHAKQKESPNTDSPHLQSLVKKVTQLTEVLEARENKLVALSRENAELMEVNNHLKRRIEQMEEENADLDPVKEEFGQRLHEAERKLTNALREKEAMKQQVMNMQQELTNRVGASDKMARLVEAKDEQISSLMMEGEKLTKQQLQSNNLIKKLRKKEKEQEEETKSLKDKTTSHQSEIAQLKSVLDSKISNEKEHSDIIKQLNAAVLNYQSEITKLKHDSDEAIEKMRRAESAVDNSYKEIAELHKNLAAKDSMIKEMKVSGEEQIREEVHRALEKKHKESMRDADHLMLQIEDLQLTASRTEKEHTRREESLREEIKDLLIRLELADKRNDDLTSNYAAATKPLLRQIENLQASHTAQLLNWEKIEKSLTERLAESQSLLLSANNKERSANEQLMDLSSRCSVMETELSSLKKDKSKLSAELEILKLRSSSLQEERNSAVSQLEHMKAVYDADKNENKKALALLEAKLEAEKTKLEAEKKKSADLQQTVHEKEHQIREISQIRSIPSPSLSTGSSDDRKAVLTSKLTMKQDELLERALSTPTSNTHSLYDSIRSQGSTALLENLESIVKQKEGEISQLQADILEHVRTRESLTKEMLKLTDDNANLDAKVKQLLKIQTQFKELNGRYQALLQMYGEKEEEVSELRLDLNDVKQMYKQQIDALMSK